MISDQCGCMCVGLPIHQRGTSYGRTDWQSGADTLSNANNVRLELVMIAGEHLPGTAHAALPFINDQENSVFVANAAQAQQEVFWRRHVSAFALDRLNDDCSNLLRRRRSFKQTLFNPM